MSISSHEGGETYGRVPEPATRYLGTAAIGGNQPPVPPSISELLPGELSRESLLEQLPATHAGYRDIVLGLYVTSGVDSVTRDVHTLENHFNAWFEPGRLQFARKWMQHDPSVRFVLTATPNLTVDAVALHGLAKLFSKDQRNVLPLDSIYRQQSPASLCKHNPGSQQPVSFSLVATNYYPTGHRQMHQQLRQVKVLQRKEPRVRVPSPPEAMTYIRTLNAYDVPLDGPDVFDLTATRHIDAEVKHDADKSGWRGRPFTLVNMDGQYSLGASSVTGLAGLRLSLS